MQGPAYTRYRVEAISAATSRYYNAFARTYQTAGFGSRSYTDRPGRVLERLRCVPVSKPCCTFAYIDLYDRAQTCGDDPSPKRKCGVLTRRLRSGLWPVLQDCAH